MRAADNETLVRASSLWLRAFIFALFFSALLLVAVVAHDLGCALAGLAFVLISICDVALGRFKYGRDAMREGRFVVWTMLKHAMRIWSV